MAGEVLYPSQGLFFFKMRDSKLLSAIFQAYNDWLGEFCAAYPDRLKGVAMVNVDDVADGVLELERATQLGLVGAISPSIRRRHGGTTARSTSLSGPPPRT